MATVQRTVLPVNDNPYGKTMFQQEHMVRAIDDGYDHRERDYSHAKIRSLEEKINVLSSKLEMVSQKVYSRDIRARRRKKQRIDSRAKNERITLDKNFRKMDIERRTWV